MPCLTLDGRAVEAAPGAAILEAAAAAGIYVPSLCWHPDLAACRTGDPARTVWRGAAELHGSNGGSFTGCDLCVVEIEGKADPVHACWTKVENGMSVRTQSERLSRRRHEAFAQIMSSHPRACLSCRQREGCPREPCSMNVPVAERCCEKLGRCAIEKLHDHLEFSAPLPPYRRDDRLAATSPLFAYDGNLCVACLRCVRACVGLRQVGALSFVMEGSTPRVGFRAPTAETAGCRFCGACAEVCPTGAILDRDGAGVACRTACPLGLDVPAYVRAVAEGRADVAARIIGEGVPFGRVLGRVCHAPCQAACRRGALNDAVEICALKRFACDAGARDGVPRAACTGKRVAVVGAGPAGLTAAWFLARKGHAVTVFEAQSEAGGMLRWGIPAFRLPPEVVRAEIEEIARLGVEIRTSARVADVGSLRREFGAVLAAPGLPRSRRLGIPGEDVEGVRHGLEFLAAVRSGAATPPGGTVLVIGGGNVAVDVALTAIRLGACAVQLVCLERDGEMPAFAREVREAREAGVEIRGGWGPVAISRADGRLRCEFRRCVAVFDEGGRFVPRFDESERMRVHADGVVVAIGQRAEEGPAPAGAGVFVAGDRMGGRCSVVDACASGKAAAVEIDRFLGGDGKLGSAAERPAAIPGIGAREGFASLAAVVPAGARRGGFDEAEPGFTRDEAQREAARCLQCDLRLDIRPAPMPPARDLLRETTEANVAAVPEAEGVLRLFGEDRRLLQIAGTANLRAEARKYADSARARYFAFEVEPYYTKRESELLQAYLREHGRMPEGVESLDDLY